jgi:molybdenum cofactor synthesis domain-containing protein
VPRPTAAIVVIGDEILSGKFVEENAAFLIGELRALGVELRRITVVPDDADDIAATVTEAASRHTWVFTSGGVGPTHDDVTIAAVARALGTDVVRDPDLEARLRAYWGDAIAPANLRLADVPRGATLVWGTSTTWPVVTIANVHILPGVPGCSAASSSTSASASGWRRWRWRGCGSIARRARWPPTSITWSPRTRA